MSTGDALPSSDGIRSRVLSGIAWKATSQIVLQVSRLAVALILARLIAPADWGLAAMVLVFSGFVIVFTDNALGTALIQRRRLTDADRSTVFWASAGIGALLMLAGYLASAPLASFYGEPDVQSLFIVLSVSFFLSSLGTTQAALLVREMKFRVLELRQIAAAVAGAVVGISVAVAGGGAWAIVLQQVADAAVSTVILWCVTPWRPSLAFSWASLRGLAGFAGNVFGENLLYQAGRNLSNLLIGRFLGAAALGSYALASNVILVPFSRIAGPLQQVFFPAFSTMQDDRPRMADVWVRVTRLVAALSMPALVGLVIVAPDFVSVVLGDRWSAAVPVIQILAWAGLVQSLQTLAGEILLALGKAGTLFRFTMVWFVASVGAFVLGLNWGVIGVAACYVAATVLVEPLRTYLACRALGFPMRKFIGALSGVAQATAIMGVACVGARELLVSQGVPPGIRLAAVVVLGMVVYFFATIWRAPDVTLELRRVLPVRRRPPAPSEPFATARLSER